MKRKRGKKKRKKFSMLDTGISLPIHWLPYIKHGALIRIGETFFELKEVISFSKDGRIYKGDK